MDLNNGFTPEDPPVTIRFGMSVNELHQLLRSRARRSGGNGLCLSCTSLGGMQHELGCVFECGLKGLAFFRKEYPELAVSFNEFQSHFEAEFGPPTESMTDKDGYPFHRWVLPGFVIVHGVYDRFGPAEQLHICIDSSWPCDVRINYLWRRIKESRMFSTIRRLLTRGQS